MTTPAELAATVREALIDAHPGPMPEHDAMCRTLSGWPDQRAKGCNCSVARNADALAALDALQAQADRVKRAEVELSDCRDDRLRLTQRAEAAEAERDEWEKTARTESDGLMKMRDEARKNFDWAKAERAGRKQERARADRLADALREIVALEDKTYWDDPSAGFAAIARAALARTEKKFTVVNDEQLEAMGLPTDADIASRTKNTP